jgi:hypothetical protein
MLFVFAVNYIGDALRDVLDPRQRTIVAKASRRLTLFKKKGAQS